jgi:Putative Actinobacterial Holin-X, holin superfamily III
MTAPTGGSDGRSVEELVQMVSEQVVALGRQEVELARREIIAKAKQAAPGAGMVGAAALLATLSTGTGTAALVLALAGRPRPCAAALAVTALYGGGAAALARTGIARVRAAGPPVPEETVQSIKEDLERVKGAAS